MANSIKKPLRILGIDPGTRVVGFALLAAKTAHPRSFKDWTVEDVGVIRPPSDMEIIDRLAVIHDTIFELIEELNPSEAAIEKAFYGINAASSLKIGEARGAIISAIGRAKLPLRQFTPAEVKRTVGGSGRASKQDISSALSTLIKFNRGHLPLDATDALAISICGALSVPSLIQPR